MSPSKTGADPRVGSGGEGDLVFDRVAGLISGIDMEYTTTTSTESVSRKYSVSLKCHLLTGDDLNKVLHPPPPEPPKKLTGEALERSGLQPGWDEPYKRADALRQLASAELENPAPELLSHVASLLNDADYSTRQSAATFLGTYGTKAQVPDLLKLLKDTDTMARQSAVKALTRLKDARAAEPLADLVARGGYDVQGAAAALMAIGPAGEDSVLLLLKERYLDTRRQACGILRQVGTRKSIDALTKLMLDPDASLSQAASDAIRTIQNREQ